MIGKTKTLKILFAPVNTASMPAITAKAINQLAGYEAKYLNFVKHKFLKENEYQIKTYSSFVVFRFSKKISIISNIYGFLFWLYHSILSAIAVFKSIWWCDVLHWSGATILPFGLELKFAKLLGKKRFIEWVGSDIRVPEVTMQESKWYKDIFYNGYEYPVENKITSYKRQSKFKDAGFTPILVPEMQLFLKPGLFERVYTTQYRGPGIYETFEPKVEKVNKGVVSILHCPSAPNAKGSNLIAPIIAKLKEKYPIEYIMLTGVPRSQVLENMMTCDIYIDQIVLGSYASAAIEAMSFGKPTLAYIMPSVFKKGLPKECPIVNVNADTLEGVLTTLICDENLRIRIGQESKAFVETFHSPKRLALELIQIYENHN